MVLLDTGAIGKGNEQLPDRTGTRAFLYTGLMEIQALARESVNNLAAILHVGYAFGAGMVSAVNPCGFAMLPAYLSLYLGADNDQFARQSWGYRLLKALGITLVVTAGFGVLFGLIGLLVSMGGSYLMAIAPWLSILVSAVLIGTGIMVLLGTHFSYAVFMRIGSRIGDPRTISIKGFFLFGMAFGATSLSCTLPIFLVVVGGALASGDVVNGMFQFLWYTLGTSSVLLILTVGMAFVKGGTVIGLLKRLMPFIDKVSAVLLILAGCYIIFYWMNSGLLFR